MAGFGGSRGQVFFLHELDVGEGGGAGNWIAAEGGEVIAGLEGGGDFRTGGERAQRKSVSDALGGDQNVGIDAEMLVGKHLPGASKAGLDFVGDEQNAVLIEDLLDLFEVIRWRHDDAAFAHHRLGNEGGDIGGSRETDDIVDRAGALAATFFGIVAPRRTVSVGSGREGNAGSVRATAFLATLVAGDAEGSPTASVKTGVESDELVLAGIEPRQLHGAFNGFGAAVAEESFGESAGSDVRDLLGEIGDGLHMVDIGRAVDKLVHLSFGGSDDLPIVVSGIDYGNAGKTIEVLAAVDIGDGSTAGVVNDNRDDRLHEAGHYVVFVFLDGVRHRCLRFFSVNLCVLCG